MFITVHQAQLAHCPKYGHGGSKYREFDPVPQIIIPYRLRHTRLPFWSTNLICLTVPLSDAIAVSWTFTLEKTTTWAVNVPQWTLARVKTSNLRIDYKPVASLSSVQVITASLLCLEYAHSYSIFGLVSAHLRIISRWFSYNLW